ncbi:MAG TPA: hypothetical protein DIT13_18255 [Verrucomicrobiales bacterium]|nr:hypothetical protein [Verrucomicrobiales bacterium]
MPALLRGFERKFFHEVHPPSAGWLPAHPSSMMKTLALSLLLPVCLLMFTQSALAQTSPVISITVTPPAGTAAAPLFVIDSDSGTAPQTRNTIAATVTVTMQRSTAATSAVFRMQGDLLPSSSSTPVSLISSSRNSAVQTIDLKGTGTVTRTFTLNLKPNEALGAGAAFRVRAQLQVETTTKVFSNVGSSVTSGSFTVVHYRDSTTSTNLNVHAHLSAAATISKGFALTTNASQRDFEVRVPLLITRYDLGDGARPINLRTIVTLEDDLGAQIPLASNANVLTTLSSLLASNTGTPNTPATRSLILTRSFRPVAQLDSVNRTYRVRVKVEIQDDAVNTTALRDLGNLVNLSNQRLLHFNGTLRFTGGAVATMTAISNTPTAGALEPNPPSKVSLATNRIRTVLSLSGGALTGQAGMTFGSITNLDARLAPDGTAEVVAMPVTTVNQPPGIELSGTFGRIKVSYASPRLTSAGLVVDAVINLPQGLGFTGERATSRNKLLRLLPAVSAVTLSSDLRHTGTLNGSITGADAWVFDEARPLWFRVTKFFFATNGELSFANPAAEWAHKGAFKQLNDQQIRGEHQVPTMADRLTNDGWLKSVEATSGTVAFTAATDGTARTTGVKLTLGEGEVRPHFPSAPAGSPDLLLEWISGNAEIENGKIKAGSTLTGAQSFTVAHESACQKEGCPQPAPSLRTVTCSPEEGIFLLTPDGGLACATDFGAPFALAWDRRENAEEFSHQTGKFSAATFFMPGHQSYVAEASLPDARAPGALLNAGLFGQTLVYPHTRAYLEGRGLYAGLNFTVTSGAEVVGEIRVADMTSGIELPLRPQVSKYYARRSGVSGRHVAQAAPDALTLYGYPFGFTKMEMAFLSNSMDGVAEPSRVNGEVQVPKVKEQTETEFTQKFTGLKIACLGALGGAEIDPTDRSAKPLSYWNGSISPKAIQFVPENPLLGDCAAGTRLLAMLVESSVANIEEPLFGSLVFRNTGNLTGLQPASLGMDGRLGLPGVVKMRGPRKGGSDAEPEFETYEMWPMSKLYFNDALDARAPDTGFVTFGALCNVPFYEDLEVQVLTSANHADTAAPFHLASGWRENGLTYANSLFFDSAHRGLPPADQNVTFLQYRNPAPNSPDFRIVAKQSIFGILDIEDKLTWNALTRDFSADPTQKLPLLVLSLEHELLYLSAERAELTFGAQFADLKHLNLANAAVEGVERLHTAAHVRVNQGARRLRRGIDRLDDLVEDRLDQWIEQYSEGITTAIFNKLHRAFEDSYNAHVINGPLGYPEWVDRQNGKLKDVVNQALEQGGIEGVTQPLREQLRRLTDNLEGSNSLLGEVKDALDQAILTLDIVAGGFLVDGQDNPLNTVFTRQPDGSLSPTIEGENARLGFISENPETGQREIASNLVRELVKASLPPDLAHLADAIFALTGAPTVADQALNELIAEADPALDSITEVLQQVKGVLVDTRNQVAAVQGLGEELQRVVDASEARLNSIVNEVRDSIFTFFDEAAERAVGGPLDAGQKVIGLFQEFSEKTLSDLLKATLRDALMESGIVQDIQHLLRQRLAELRHHLHDAIDQIYARLSKITKKIAKKFLAPIDEQVNKILGKLPDVLGAGSVDGYADIVGDTLRRLRLDAKVELSLPEKMQLEAFFEMSCFDSSTDLEATQGCPAANGDKTVEVRVAALDIPLSWTPSVEPSADTVAEAAGGANPNAEENNDELRASLGIWFGFAGGEPNSIGGSFEMTSGEFDFESVVVSDVRAAVAIGFEQAYLAAGVRVKVSEYQGSGGVFFGRTCSIEPLRLVDPDAAAVLGDPPFTGAYVAGEVWVPISEVAFGVPATCMFTVSAGVGAGVFYFADGPVFGGRLDLGISGEALCAVTFSADLGMVGVLTPTGFNYRGVVTVSARVGPCPLCAPFDRSFPVNYKDGNWSFE